MANTYPKTFRPTEFPMDLRGIPDFPGSFPAGPWDPGYPDRKILPDQPDMSKLAKRLRKKALAPLGPMLVLELLDGLWPYKGKTPQVPGNYRLYYDCGSRPDTHLNLLFGQTCVAGAIDNERIDEGVWNDDFESLFQLNGPYIFPNQTRYESAQVWERIEGATWWPDYPAVTPAKLIPIADPQPYPQVDPDTQRPLVPQVQPAPLPWIEVPVRVGTGFPQEFEVGYSMPRPYQPYVPPLTDFVAEPFNPTRPGIYPVPQIPPRGDPPVVWPTTPEPGEKEKKIKMHTALRVSLRFVNFVTEAVDLMDALYWALPDKLTSGRHNATQRAQVLWDNIDEVDWNQALENIALNEFQDRILGAAGNRVGKLSRALGRPVGLQAGPAL